MSQQFISRLINHLVNVSRSTGGKSIALPKSCHLTFVCTPFPIYVKEVLIKGLAESRTFQRFAVRTQASVEEAKKAGTEIMAKGIESLTAEEMIAVNNKGPPRPPQRGVPGFFIAFGKEIRKDMGMGK
jgi:hypothetical protein